MSKDERIELSQFEGITEGPWWINHEDGDGATSIWNGTIDEGNMNHVADFDGNETDLALIAKLPELIGALKKAYEREDQLMKVHSDTREWAWEALDWIEGKVKHRDLRTVDAQAFKKWRREFEHFMDGTNTDAPE
tara:strand:- start:180 stop:584 length:405 start_codon:yes stop_codon:yes gene_type:complete